MLERSQNRQKCCSLAVKRKIENRDLNACQVGLEQQANLMFPSRLQLIHNAVRKVNRLRELNRTHERGASVYKTGNSKIIYEVRAHRVSSKCLDGSITEIFITPIWSECISPTYLKLPYCQFRYVSYDPQNKRDYIGGNYRRYL